MGSLCTACCLAVALMAVWGGPQEGRGAAEDPGPQEDARRNARLSYTDQLGRRHRIPSIKQVKHCLFLQPAPRLLKKWDILEREVEAEVERVEGRQYVVKMECPSACPFQPHQQCTTAHLGEQRTAIIRYFVKGDPQRHKHLHTFRHATRCICTDADTAEESLRTEVQQ